MAAAVVLGLATPGLATPGLAGPPPFDTGTETSYRRVTWDDFKGGLGSSPSGRGIERAWISTAIHAVPFEVKVTSTRKGHWVASPISILFYSAMNKAESSAGQGARTDLLLAHEQGHFDLTEVVARRLNRRLDGVESRGATGEAALADVKQKIDRAYQQASAELAELQARYDEETWHGKKRVEQREWIVRIGEMLAETADLWVLD